MTSLILTLDPRLQGGVRTMQQAMTRAHEQLGLDPVVAYTRTGRRERYSLPARPGRVGAQRTISFGYVPAIAYLNYLAPALAFRPSMRSFPVVQIVAGYHSASLVPILAGHPFVSWVATSYVDEVASRYRDDHATLSVRLNYRLRALNRALERWTYRFPARVFVLSHYTARALQEVTGLPPSFFEVLRTPIDSAAFTPDGRRWERAPGRYVVSMGRVGDGRKHYTSLVRCFARIASLHPDVSLVIAGAANPGDPAVRLARQLGVGERVHFPGDLRGEELAAAYRGADVYLMTSRQEGLGIAILEAQASGTPALVMRCGGSDEIVQPGETGWLVDQADEEAFAARLGEVLRDEALRERVGRTARARVQAIASFDAFTRALRSAYADVFGVT